MSSPALSQIASGSGPAVPQNTMVQIWDTSLKISGVLICKKYFSMITYEYVYQVKYFSINHLGSDMYILYMWPCH